MRSRYHTLPHGCLLLLCADGDAAGLPLADTLRTALRSGQPHVWVDCQHVATLPAEALAQLRHCAARLWQHGGHLVLCHLPAAVRSLLAASPAQPLAASLLDAELYGLDCPPAPAVATA